MLKQADNLRARFREEIRQRQLSELMKARRASFMNFNSGDKVFQELY